MKSVTVCLVALTVFTTLFLESSSAAVQVKESVKQLIDEKLTVNEGIIASAKKTADDASLTAEGGLKESLTRISNWLKNKLELTVKLHKEINNLLNDGSIEALKPISAEVTAAAGAHKTQWAELSGNLRNDKVKPVLNEKVNTIFANAGVIDEKLKELVSEAKN